MFWLQNEVEQGRGGFAQRHLTGSGRHCSVAPARDVWSQLFSIYGPSILDKFSGLATLTKKDLRIHCYRWLSFKSQTGKEGPILSWNKVIRNRLFQQQYHMWYKALNWLSISWAWNVSKCSQTRSESAFPVLEINSWWLVKAFNLCLNF